MTGLERLREIQGELLGYNINASLLGRGSSRLFKMEDEIESAVSQAKREQAEDHEIAEWVRDNGGIENIQDELANDRDLAMIVRDALWPDGKVPCCENGNEQIADELDKRLMPPGMEWPKVDGKKVDFTTGYEPSLGVLEAVEIYNNGACNVMSHDGIVKSVSEIHIAKQDPVGADGLPIKRGDTVYDKNSGDRLIVGAIEDGGYTITCRYADLEDSAIPTHGSWSPCDLTHRAPVLAADGEPLEVGQTVWRDDGEMLEVLYLRPDGLVDCCGEIERPERLTHQLPVLDAEGNRIEPAMDVWWVCDGDERGVHAEKLHVESIGEDGLVTCDPFNGGTWVELEPSELYVNRPVLDADGVPIHEGDTVWLTDGRGPWKVSRIVCADRWRVICDDEENGHLNVYPDHLTHTKPEPPDSWEQIEKDAKLKPFGYISNVLGWDMRKTHSTNQAVHAMTLDIVRRAKALAEREKE